MHSLLLAAQHFRLSRFNLLRLSMAAIGDPSQSISCRGPIAQHLFFILEQKNQDAVSNTDFLFQSHGSRHLISLHRVDPLRVSRFVY